MELPYVLSIFGPITVILMIAVVIYIKVESTKLHREIIRNGQLVHSVPVVITLQNISQDSINHENLRSPTTGLPPPPPYSTAPIQSVNANSHQRPTVI